MRAGTLDNPADLVELTADLQPHTLDWLWISIRTKDNGIAAPIGLRSRAQVTVRAWWDERLVQGRYLRTEGRLLHIDSVQDVTGQQAELQVSATELIGSSAEYRPSEHPPVQCRVHLTHEAPWLDEMGVVTDYKTRAEVALIEVGRPQVSDQLNVSGTLYTVIAYANESDDGVVRGLWLERV